MSNDPAECISLNEMRAPNGDLFYPDNPADAKWFTEIHEAVPVYPALFPFDLAEPVLRARVTFTVDVLASAPLEVADADLSMWVSDRFGRVCDAGPHWMLVPVPGQLLGERRAVEFGAIQDGPVRWMDGTPQGGWHCTECRQPKRPEVGPCMRLVPFGGREYPCGIDDADHHGACSFKPGNAP